MCKLSEESTILWLFVCLFIVAIHLVGLLWNYEFLSAILSIFFCFCFVYGFISPWQPYFILDPFLSLVFLTSLLQMIFPLESTWKLPVYIIMPHRKMFVSFMMSIWRRLFLLVFTPQMIWVTSIYWYFNISILMYWGWS